MTTDELIKRLNKSERIKAESDAKGIVVYNDSGNALLAIPFEATNFLEIVFNDQLPADSMGKASREYVAAQIEEYLQTPIDKRQSEKKYALAWDGDDNGKSNYFVKHNGGWFLVNKRSDQLPDEALFTQSELDRIKWDAPWLSGAIDAMKVPVKESSHDS